MARKTLTKDWATYARGDFRIENNVWNKGDLENGSDYKQTISYDTRDLTNELKFAWNWPKTDHILAFPEIEAGYKPWSETGPDTLTTQISKMRRMDVSFDYDIAGNKTMFNVGFDMWLTKKPESNAKSITTEVSVWTHVGSAIDPDGKKIGIYRDGDFRGEIWVDNHYGHDGSSQTWRYITVRATKDVLDGTLDIDHLLDTLIAKKLVNARDYFNGYEFGAQLTGGKGALLIHDLDHDFARSRHAADVDFHDVAAADQFLF